MTPEDFLKSLAFKTVEKVWGKEYWLVNDEKLNRCVKLLEIKPRSGTSVHRHLKKDEAIIPLYEGTITFYNGPQRFPVFEAPYELFVPAGKWHSLENIQLSLSTFFVEISTFHSDDDVERGSLSYSPAASISATPKAS